jgi:hypothetical protein
MAMQEHQESIDAQTNMAKIKESDILLQNTDSAALY